MDCFSGYFEAHIMFFVFLLYVENSTNSSLSVNQGAIINRWPNKKVLLIVLGQDIFHDPSVISKLVRYLFGFLDKKPKAAKPSSSPSSSVNPTPLTPTKNPYL